VCHIWIRRSSSPIVSSYTLSQRVFDFRSLISIKRLILHDLVLLSNACNYALAARNSDPPQSVHRLEAVDQRRCRKSAGSMF
jgi:hypothetical protein